MKKFEIMARDWVENNLPQGADISDDVMINIEACILFDCMSSRKELRVIKKQFKK